LLEDVIDLRLAQDGLFDIPRSRTAFGSRAFSTTGPQAWNQLPTDIRNTATYTTFKHNLKTFLFNTKITKGDIACITLTVCQCAAE